MERIKIIAFTHKTTDLSNIGKLHIGDDELKSRLESLKLTAKLDELLFLSTCNRIEFMIVTPVAIDSKFLQGFFAAFNPKWNKEEIHWAMSNAQVFEGEHAFHHLFDVASSLDSLVVGEREIITQVRNAYDKCCELGITGDLIRLVVKRTIEVAKDVYTHTNIAKNPVSVVSLAYRELLALNVKSDARFIIIGSGVTNTHMAKYLKKNKFNNFTIFNRTLAHAETLAAELSGKALPLSELTEYTGGFDVMITCTGSSGSIITPEIYKSLVGNDTSKKVVIDLAIPNDLDAEILNNYDVSLIAIDGLQETAKENLQTREHEIVACNAIIARNMEEFKQILKTRKVEKAMSEVPQKIKEIRVTANEVFAKELSLMDDQSRIVLDEILLYMEKKFISVPMKMAKAILVEANK